MTIASEYTVWEVEFAGRVDGTIDPAKKYYKVLRNGGAFNGGALRYPLPNGDKPGEWLDHGAIPVRCQSGFHLTTEPAIWFGNPGIDDPGKVSVERVRLTRQVVGADLAIVRIFTEGEHTVSAGPAHAYGSATVTAYGSATVTAYNSATVRAYGSATVRASGSATVRAEDAAIVRAGWRAAVTAFHLAMVTVTDDAACKLYGEARCFDRRNGKVRTLRAGKKARAKKPGDVPVVKAA